jgi:hypothetical protein
MPCLLRCRLPSCSPLHSEAQAAFELGWQWHLLLVSVRDGWDAGTLLHTSVDQRVGCLHLCLLLQYWRQPLASWPDGGQSVQSTIKSNRASRTS